MTPKEETPWWYAYGNKEQRDKYFENREWHDMYGWIPKEKQRD